MCFGFSKFLAMPPGNRISLEVRCTLHHQKLCSVSESEHLAFSSAGSLGQLKSFESVLTHLGFLLRAYLRFILSADFGGFWLCSKYSITVRTSLTIYES